MTVQSALNLYRQHPLHLTIPLPDRELYETLIEKVFQDANLLLNDVQFLMREEFLRDKAFTVISFCTQPITVRKVLAETHLWYLSFGKTKGSRAIRCGRETKIIILRDDSHLQVKSTSLDYGNRVAELFHLVWKPEEKIPTTERIDSVLLPRNTLRLPSGMQWIDLVEKLEEVGLVEVERKIHEIYLLMQYRINWVSELKGECHLILSAGSKPNSNLQPIHYHLLYLYHIRCGAFTDE